MWALELVRHGLESCTLCLTLAFLWPRANVLTGRPLQPLCLFQGYDIPQYTPLLPIFLLGFPYFLFLSPFVSLPDLFLPLSASVLCLARRPFTSHEPCTEEGHFSTLCNVNLTSPKGPVEIHRDTCSPCNMQGLLRQEYAMTPDLRAGIALPTRVSKDNSFPHCLPLPSHHLNPDLPVSLQDLPRQGA